MSEQLLKEPDKLVQLLMPIGLVTKIDRLARSEGVSRAKLIRDFSESGVENFRQDENKTTF